MFFGWIKSTSCQSKELASKTLLKRLAENLNNSNIFMQFLLYWERIEQLMRVQREHSEAVGESVGADENSDEEDAYVEDSHGTKTNQTK